MKCRVQEQPVQHSLSMCLARPDLCLGEVGGDAIDADAFGDGVEGVLQALALGFMPGVQDPPLDLVEQAGPRGVYEHHLHHSLDIVQLQQAEVRLSYMMR